MNRPIALRFVFAVVLLGGIVLLTGLQAADPEPEKPVPPKTVPARPAPPAVKNKPLSRLVTTGLAFLAGQQQANGGWGSGDGMGMMGLVGAPKTDPPRKGVKGAPKDNGQVKTDVADTSIAGLAFLRAGYEPRKGTYSRNLLKAVEYVCSHIEQADRDSLSITDVTGTTVQRKIGTYVDTFLAALFLAEVKGKMPDDKGEKRVTAALDKIMAKMKANQQEDGSWQTQGWAPVLSQALASRAANRSRQVGIVVDDTMLQRMADLAKTTFDKNHPDALARSGKDVPAKGTKGAPVKGTPLKGGPGPFVMGDFGGGAAGVSLYATAAQIGALHANFQTHKQLGESARGVLESPNSTDEDRKAARAQLARLTSSEKVLAEVTRVTAQKVTDQKFVRGFGSDGGEEFISFMLIGETLRAMRSKEWPAWDKSMTERLSRSQNKDGSWSGKHCIVGQTFCTSAAVLTLLVDRSPNWSPLKAE